MTPGAGTTSLFLGVMVALGCAAESSVAVVETASAPVLVIGKQQATITAADGAAFDRFGDNVAISGTTALVGAAKHSIGSVTWQGAAYVFTQSGTTWTQEAKLLASDGAANDYFGGSVAIEGNTAVVGSARAVYVFVRAGTTWTQQAKLVPTDHATADTLNRSLSIVGDRVLVGSIGKTVGTNVGQGAAYVFARTGSTWTQEAKLTASDGATDQFFGIGSLGTSMAVVGSLRTANAYVFVRNGSTWSEQAKLTRDDATPADELGGVALAGTTAMVGVPTKNMAQGTTYVFEQSGTAWSQKAKLVAPDGAVNHRFGASVAIAATTAIIGRGTTAAYVFERKGDAWSLQNTLKPTGGGTDDSFGSHLALTPTLAIVGDWTFAVGKKYSQGAAYVFATAHTVADACTTPDECLSGFCATGFCCETACVGDCSSGKCVDSSVCEGNVLKSPNGTDEDCAPYACRDKKCLVSCDTSSDCTAGSVCDPTIRACSASSPATAEDEGGCAIGFRGSHLGAGLLALVALGLVRRRRAP